MNPQDRSLSESMLGEEVDLWHGELLQLREADLFDAEIGADEASGQFFGPTTYEAVVHFQELFLNLE